MFHSIQIAIATLTFSAILGTATTEAGVFKYSTSFISFPAPYPNPWLEFDLTMPKYAGSVASVTLSIAGQSSAATDDIWYDASQGLSIPTSPVSWDVQMFGLPSNTSLLLAHVDTYLNGITIDPCYDPACVGLMEEVNLYTDTTSYSAVTSVSNLSDFEGHGENSFLVLSYLPFYGFFSLSGTVTETMVTVPEPSTWAMMLLGCAGLGFAGYRRSLAA